MTIAFQGVNYLRPEKMLDFATISPAPVRAVTPLALLYSTVGVLRQVELRKLPVYISGRVVYPISSLTMPGLRARLIINATSQRLKFLESLIASSASDNVHGMQILGPRSDVHRRTGRLTQAGCTAPGLALMLTFCR
ncbi:dTDP-glucose pyrophosphorylase [Klebsiella pneumoniae subsp. pneumoniae]|nr:dTDP-glucose pyrophosphorylase [Klebsiella pneumoniae subsp. pneumoniae]